MWSIAAQPRVGTRDFAWSSTIILMDCRSAVVSMQIPRRKKGYEAFLNWLRDIYMHNRHPCTRPQDQRHPDVSNAQN
ncbi:hypothetical protein ARMGADRAFT_619905 [Armillaria gallica]|uniref:Uncharacterized protein n=1 Tax=Armillaria gallica TaxID=47427 RepID=A0A2H3CM14_ARMGA|nr:hypothetical protein ARMGADRAFT_619905 [Armillaria gallica]